MVVYDPIKDAEGWPSPAEGTPLLRIVILVFPFLLEIPDSCLIDGGKSEVRK